VEEIWGERLGGKNSCPKQNKAVGQKRKRQVDTKSQAGLRSDIKKRAGGERKKESKGKFRRPTDVGGVPSLRV